jgi:GntR family transcriptional regulator/MocR family aminotransferase
MTPHPSLNAATLRLDRGKPEPLYRQLYERIRQSILSGQLSPGTRLPSTRTLANQLSTTRGTIKAAYEMLVVEGYTEGRGAAGTVVAPTLLVPGQAPKSSSTKAAREKGPKQPTRPARPLLLQLGVPALDEFPRKLWSRAVSRRVRAFDEGDSWTLSPNGYLPLREQIVNYLSIARGIACGAEQIFITAGFCGALGLLTRALLQRGDQVWIEDPGYLRTRDALRVAEMQLAPIPVDDEGLDVSMGSKLAPTARCVVVTPSHQAPLGMPLSLQRRLFPYCMGQGSQRLDNRRRLLQ